MPEVNDATSAASGPESQWSTARAVSGSGNAGLSIEDFYKLLAAQLRYQDADNPMDTSEMMAQMVQTQMIETINQMNQISLITYASSMIGKEVTVALIDEKTGMLSGKTETGTVTGASIFGESPMLFVDGKSYYLSQVTMLGSRAEKPEGDGGDKDSGEDDKGPGPTDGPGEDDKGPGPTDGAEGDDTKPPEVPGEGGSATQPPEGEGGNDVPPSGENGGTGDGTQKPPEQGDESL